MKREQEEYREWLALMEEARQIGLSQDDVRRFLDDPHIPELLKEGTRGHER